MTDGWYRDATPHGECACGHLLLEHRTDLETARCNRGGCPCPTYQQAALLWREHRTIREATP